MTRLPLRNLGAPVYGATKYGEFLVPRVGGGWMYGEQFYVYPNHNPTEWIVTHLETGDFTRQVDNIYTTNTRGQYANTNFNRNNQLRSSSGRVFFPAQNNYVWYYDPATELVRMLPKIPSIGTANSDSLAFSMAFNHDGSMLYGGSAGNNLASFRPEVFSLDPVTLAVNTIARVGTGAPTRTQLGYAYFLWADGNYLYVCVGENLWEVVAVNLTTGATTTLGSSSTNAFASFEMKPEGLTAKVFTNHGLAGETVDQFWCVDGARYAYAAGYDPATLPFTHRDVTQYSNPVVSPPQIDTASFGDQGVLWRANGSSGAWTLDPFAIQYGAGLNLESLAVLPDQSVIGNAETYAGWFRYYPKTGVTTYFGLFQGVSGEPGARLVVNGKLYASGYPNGPLWEYDPNAAWDNAGGTNPKKLGAFSDGTILSAMKRATYFRYSAVYNRLYAVGLLERSGTGGGIGYYDFGSKAFGGTHTNLNFYQGHLGLAVFDNLDRVVFGGLIGDDPAFPGGTPTVSQLVLYDHNLTEIERQTPIAGLLDTGNLFRTDEATVVVGVSAAGVLYRWDIVSKTLLAQTSFVSLGALGRFWQVSTEAVVAVIGVSLYRVGLKDLSVTKVGDFADAATAAAVGAITQAPSVGPQFYLASGPTLYSYNLQATSSKKRRTRMYLNEATASMRTASLHILADDGTPLASGFVWTAGMLKVVQPNGTIANATNNPTAGVAGSIPGSFNHVIAQAELQQKGDLRIQWSGAGLTPDELVVRVEDVPLFASSTRASNLDNLDAQISTRARPSDVPSAVSVAGQVDATLVASHGAGSWQQGNTAAPPASDVIAAAVWQLARAGNQTAGSFGEFIDAHISAGATGGGGGGTVDTAAVAAAVWDMLRSGHQTAGSFGELIDAKISAAGGGGGGAPVDVSVIVSGVLAGLLRPVSSAVPIVGVASYDVGDLEPPMQLPVKFDGVNATLALAASAVLRWKKPDGTVTTVPLTFADRINRVVQRTWSGGDLSQPGIHSGEVVITWPDGRMETVQQLYQWTVRAPLA